MCVFTYAEKASIGWHLAFLTLEITITWARRLLKNSCLEYSCLDSSCFSSWRKSNLYLSGIAVVTQSQVAEGGTLGFYPGHLLWISSVPLASPCHVHTAWAVSGHYTYSTGPWLFLGGLCKLSSICAPDFTNSAWTWILPPQGEIPAADISNQKETIAFQSAQPSFPPRSCSTPLGLRKMWLFLRQL